MTARGQSEGILAGRALECLFGGVKWVALHLDLFTPGDAKIPVQMKAATELAMFYGFTARWQHPQVRPQMVAIRQFLVDLYADPAITYWLQRFPCHYAHYATGYLALRAAGERIPAFEEALSRVHRMGYPFAIEKTPHREMASQYSHWKAGLRVKRPPFGNFFRATSLARCRNPVYLTTPDVYSITHTLLYVTDIAGPCPNMLATERRRAVDLVETLLVHYWRKPDWDLTGELLLNLVGLNEWRTALFESAFADLLTSQNDDGTVPGPQFPTNHASPNRKQTFDGCYHTSLVAMFLCEAYIHRTQGNARQQNAS